MIRRGAEGGGVTVGMPVYNNPSGLLRSVPTVFNQTWAGDLRLLIIDDGSTDDTPSVIESLVDIYERIDVVRNPANRGRPFARNQIVSEAQSEYLAWLDCGDLWHPRKLELQVDALRDAGEVDQPLLCTVPFRFVFSDNNQEQVRTPEVSGDQLYNALSSTLNPYLWTMLGRAEHFRNAGGFDERLARRQDYEFLVRFIERGGRVISTEPDLPLCTYLKSDVGGSPREVASANRVLRSIHRPLYARYGPGFTRRIRHKQSVLVARFYRNNGQRLPAMAYKAMGWVFSPSLPSPRRALRRLAGATKRAAFRVARLGMHTLRPALPFLRRIGLTSMARRVATPLGIMPAFYGELRTADPTGRSAAQKLERRIDARQGGSSPSDWLRLEQVYRDRGRLASAQTTLQRGLAEHPGDARLQSRLVELLALRGAWAEAIGVWESLSTSQRDQAGTTTYSRAAWAYRTVDDTKEALAVADEGLGRWPSDQRLQEELYKSRALATDWSQAAIGMEGAAGSNGEEPGLVAELGFLVGSDGPIRGWIHPGHGLNVELLVNGSPIASTGAAPADHRHTERLDFAFNCEDLIYYLGDGDTVSFRSRGATVPIEDFGPDCVFSLDYPSRVDELQDKLAVGYVFQNLGRLEEGNTPKRKAATLALYDRVRELVAKETGYTVYPIYGNLLGAVRDNDFIAHDVGGFDVVYLSSHRRSDAVRAEFVAICTTLMGAGYHLKLKPWSAYVQLGRGSNVFVDLNYAWFNELGELNISYGWRFAPVTDPALFTFPREATLGRHLVPVPGNAEAVLSQIYGPTWVTPDQGFVPEDKLVRDPEFLLSSEDLETIRDHDPDLVEVASVSR